MLEKLTEQKLWLEAKLTEARRQRGEAAFQSSTGDKAARQRVAAASEQIRAIESDLEINAEAISHAERIENEQRRIAEELARQKAAEERKRALQESAKAMESTVDIAAEIDELLNAVGVRVTRWRESFDAAAAAIQSLVPSAHRQLDGVGKHGLSRGVYARLVAIGLVHDRTMTTAELQIPVRDVAQGLAWPFTNAVQNEESK